MKKYLIKGLLALVVGGLTASCADKEGDYVPLDQQKSTAYAEVFKELIGGEVDPNHDWGFTQTSLVDDSAKARTRYVDVNGNMWKDHPTLGATESTDVKNWVNMTKPEMRAAGHNYYEYVPQNLTNYWVTQVWKGTDSYENLDKQSGIVGSDHMDNLHIKERADAGAVNDAIDDGWYHVNNFNSGNDTDWWGNTLVLNSGTFDFAYHGSEDSKYHNRWIIVKGSDIKAEYAGYYYVCFDFEEMIGNPTTKFEVSVTNPYRNENYTETIEISGAYTDETQIIASGYTTYTRRIYNPNTNQEEDYTWNLTTDNLKWTQVVNGNQCVPPNDVYTDWIIRLVDATPGGGGSSSTSTRTDRIERRRLVAQGRIFCEDLGTTKVTKSDIDFNDAVFDAKIWRLGQFDISYINDEKAYETDYLENIYPKGLDNGKFKYVAEICLLAAGGTVPLKIGGNNGFEIHNKFGEGNGRSIGHTTIINTMGEPSEQQFKALVNTDVCNKVTLEVDITYLVEGKSKIGLDIIPIDVQWVSDTHESVGELAANFGQTPQKLCVPIGTRWVYERIPITDAYGDFASYATSRNPDFWEGEKINPSLLYPSSPEGMTAETDVTDNVNYNPYYDRVVTAGTTTTITDVETIVYAEEQVYNDSDGPNQEYNLYSTTFSEGNILRLYGSKSADGAWITIHDSGWQAIVAYSNMTFNNDGYIDSAPLTADQAAALSNGPLVKVAARGLTITKMCKVVRTTSTN